MQNAPVLTDAYAGPVLFEPQAAAAIFARQFARRFAGGQRPVGSRTAPDDFARKLDKRVLPTFLNVCDDPTQAEVAGQTALGHYRIDDQGVPAARVELVSAGRLKALLMSRNPSKEFASSNGHGRGPLAPRAGVGCLLVTAQPASDAATLRKELLEACDDEGLSYGIRIATLGDGGGGSERYGGYGGERDDFGGVMPLLAYKVFPDGREELVRGAEFARFDLKAFKRMLAAGDAPHVLNTGGWATGRTIAVPALLFEELDLARIDRDFDRPPILPNPLAREDASKPQVTR